MLDFLLLTGLYLISVLMMLRATLQWRDLAIQANRTWKAYTQAIDDIGELNVKLFKAERAFTFQNKSFNKMAAKFSGLKKRIEELEAEY